MCDMIIFFGTRQVVRDDDRPGEGVRQCPHCGQFVVFKPRRARTFVHLFWIPLFPIDAGQPLIECPNCRTRFDVAM
jgi:DNA-directed RNA polymerase subunit RPC12/RpoP